MTMRRIIKFLALLSGQLGVTKLYMTLSWKVILVSNNCSTWWYLLGCFIYSKQMVSLRSELNAICGLTGSTIWYIQSWLSVTASSMTAPHMLYWNMLRWNFDGECVDMILGHNVEYTGSMSRLPILVLGCPKGDQLERGHATGACNLAFSWGNAYEIAWNFHGRILLPRPTFSRGIHSPGPLAPFTSMQKPHVWVGRLLSLVKQQRDSDRVILWQVNKTHQRQSGNLDLDCHIRSCWGWSRLPSLDTSESDQVRKAPDCHEIPLATAVDNLNCLEISRLSPMSFVYMSKYHPATIVL